MQYLERMDIKPGAGSCCKNCKDWVKGRKPLNNGLFCNEAFVIDKKLLAPKVGGKSASVFTCNRYFPSLETIVKSLTRPIFKRLSFYIPSGTP